MVFYNINFNYNYVFRKIYNTMIDFYKSNGFYSPLKIFNTSEAKIFRKKLETAENILGPLHYYSKTYTMMKWVYNIAVNKLMLDFVEQIIGKNILLYNATFIIKEPKSKTYVS